MGAVAQDARQSRLDLSEEGLKKLLNSVVDALVDAGPRNLGGGLDRLADELIGLARAAQAAGFRGERCVEEGGYPSLRLCLGGDATDWWVFICLWGVVSLPIPEPRPGRVMKAGIVHLCSRAGALYRASDALRRLWGDVEVYPYGDRVDYFLQACVEAHHDSRRHEVREQLADLALVLDAFYS